MPTYGYICKDGHRFDIIKSVRMIDDPESCPDCQSLETKREIQRTTFYGASDWDNVTYNPGLGCVTRNAKDAARKAKERGLVEVGNEDLGKTIAAQERKLEATTEEKFESSFKSMEYGLKKDVFKSI
jgi:putative FmdB family regulatory protein